MAGCTPFPNFASLPHGKGNAYVIHFIKCFCGRCNVCSMIKAQRKLCFIFTLMKQKEKERERARELIIKKLRSGLNCTPLISMWVAWGQILCCHCSKESPWSLFSQPVVHILSHGCFFIRVKEKSLLCAPPPLML